jgi:hypothetical protein
MRLPLVLVAMVAATPATSAGPAPVAPIRNMPVLTPTPFVDADCPPISRFHARGGPEKPMPRKLTDLPDADVYASVYRRIGGCEAPVIIRYGPGLNKR